MFIVSVAHECTNKVKISRLQILTLKFESLKMSDNETIVAYNVKLCIYIYIVNESFAFEKKISKEELVKKILCSLPKQFEMKVTVIEET